MKHAKTQPLLEHAGFCAVLNLMTRHGMIFDGLSHCLPERGWLIS
jgi:hypothetical protein